MALDSNFAAYDDETPPDALTDKPKREPAPRPRRRLRGSDLVVGVLLVAVMVGAAYFRFVGQNWDDFTHLHPDERFLTQVAENIGGPLNLTDPDPATRAQRLQQCQERYPDTNGVGPLFDSQCSNWYPKNVGHGLYVYGELPLFVVRIAAEITQEAHLNGLLPPGLTLPGPLEDLAQRLNLRGARGTPDDADDLVAASWTGYNGIHLIGRSVSAVAELLSLLVLFAIGRALYNKWVGLLAVAFGAAAVFPIQLSHFWTTDAFTNLPVLIAFYFAVRAMRRARWIDLVGFGFGMGCAMASRINTLPLFGVIVLAMIIWALPALDRALPPNERNRIFQRALAALMLAGIVTLITFRFTNPHAFVGGQGVLGILDIRPYQPFLADLAQAQYLTSGNADFPPNHQWASRPPYIFPARNIVLWGLGVPLGVAGWLGLLWASWQILRARPGWTRHALTVAWVVAYFGYMGRQWVMTMRYYMPIYPFLILLAAWALYELAGRAWRWMRANPVNRATVRRLAFGASCLLLAFVLAFTYLWATMYTSVYRRQLTRVEASYWVLDNVPSAISTTVNTPEGQTHLVNTVMYALPTTANITNYAGGERQIMPLAVERPGAAADRVIINRLLDAQGKGTVKSFYAALAMSQDGAQIVAMGSVFGDFSQNTIDAFGGSYTITFDKAVSLSPGASYYLVTWASGSLVVSRPNNKTSDFVLTNASSDVIANVRLPDADNFSSNMQASAILDSSVPILVNFKAPSDGVIRQIDLAHVVNPLHSDVPITLTARLIHGMSSTTLTKGTLSTTPAPLPATKFGAPVSIPLDPPVTVTQGQELTIEVAVDPGGLAQITGTVIATEGPWDDPVPQKVCDMPATVDMSQPIAPGQFTVADCRGLDAWGTYYRGLELYMSAEDDYQKLDTLQKVLDETDYITFSSNRFYDTLTRIPTRFPLSIAFYRALFGGELGFTIARQVESTFALGDFRIPDQNYPTDTSPAWANEWESEEAFSVYDHPTVFIFKKDPARYDPKVTAQILGAVPLEDAGKVSFLPDDPTIINVIRWGALPASTAPTALQMPADLRATQAQGGTWSELFPREWLINAQPWIGVALWWLAIMLFGFAVWPILFVLFPGLPDRGYPLTKLAGLLLVSWVAWVLGTLRLPVWSQGGLLLILLAMAALSAWLGWRRRAELVAYVRANARHFVIIELITAVLFVAFLFVRLGNPDLWAQSLGGEKPMNFAYFNAVLRSTVFPPYDPWYAGGYLNYYYYGYVLVGAPVKLIGMLPQVAYNVIVPTLFALTGIGAFSLAFNLAASRWFSPRDEGRPERAAPLAVRRLFALRTPQASPYVAGILAILLCIVLGNLDTPRVFATGVARAGGCTGETPDIYSWQLSQFSESEGRPPTPEETSAMLDTASNPGLLDQIKFGVYNLGRQFSCIGSGIQTAVEGGVLPIGPDRWYWGPRSVVGELPGNSNEINEFPFFTFVYGDLHAHMIALPITLLAVAWLLGEVLIAGRKRPLWVLFAATALGGLAVGILRPTNTWDWITYLIVGLVGIPFAIYMRRERLTRANLTVWVAQIGLFYAMTIIAAVPFTMYFATAYNAVKSFEGNKTPIWAYLSMHGQFLFVIVSLFVWQTARLLRHVYVRDFVGRTWPLTVALVGLGVAALIAIIMAVAPVKIALLDMPIPLALLLVPLIAWCALLFLIPGQTREWQFLYAMIGLALVLSLGVEIVVLDGDIGRQNTFFKFYIQVWMLLSIASGVGLAWLLTASRGWRAGVRMPWLTMAALLLSTAALFPVMSTQGKNAMRMAPAAPRSLDGNAYMDYATYYEGASAVPMADDLKMINWLRDNVQGTPTILETHQYPSEYKYNTRIAINTGLPTILGWRFHQQQQRTLDPLPNLVVQRESNVTALYNTTDIATAWRLLKWYQVEYIIVGKLEQVVYPGGGLGKFDTMVSLGLLETVYDENGDRIYRVISDAMLPTTLVVGMNANLAPNPAP